MYRLTIRMHFDQFTAVQKEKFYFFTTHPIFSIVSPCTLSNEKYWKVNSIFQIYWHIIVDQIHTYQILQTDLVWLRMLSWFSINYWLLASGVSFNVLLLIFECVPPPPPWPNMPFCQQIFLAHSHNISKWHSGSRGGTGSAKQKKTLKNSLKVYEKKDFRLFSKHQLYKCIY